MAKSYSIRGRTHPVIGQICICRTVKQHDGNGTTCNSGKQMLRTGSDDCEPLPKAQRDMKIAWCWLPTPIPQFIPFCPSQAERGKEVITAKAKVLEGFIGSLHFSPPGTWSHSIKLSGSPEATEHC